MREITKIKRGFGIRPIRNEKELKALIYFCKRALNDKHLYEGKIGGSFTKHDWVWWTTIKLYEDNESSESLRLLKHPYNDKNYWIIDVWDFIDAYCGWYWD